MNNRNLAEINDLFAKLSKLSQETKQIAAHLSQAINEILAIPLAAIVEATQTFQEHTLSPRQQNELIAKIQHLSNESLTILNNLVALSQLTLTQKTTQASAESTIDMSCLMGVQTLLVDDDAKRRQLLQKQLQALKLICNAVALEEALPSLQQAVQTNSAYQMIIVSSDQLDHHTAYLGRTIKANPHYQNMMPVLALTPSHHKTFDFEIERAHFSGFNCVLAPMQDQAFAAKLAIAWQSWPTKDTFKKMPVKSQHVLIVEDEPTAQFSAEHQLKQLGFTVDIAANGQKALHLLEHNNYDLIFMDIGLPDISGLEVTAEIRKREQGKPRTPIIGLTIYALEEDEKHGLNVGMDDYLVKPLLHKRLQEILQKWLKN